MTPQAARRVFGGKSHGHHTMTFREKNNTKVESFSTLSFDVYTHVDYGEHKRVIKNKGDEFRWKKSMKIS